MKEILSMDQVSYSYPTGDDDETSKAIDGVSFTVNDGEWIAIVGHNGSGKSTLGQINDWTFIPGRRQCKCFS